MLEHTAIEVPVRTVGIDLGDRFSQVTILDADAKVVEEARVRTDPEQFQRRFGTMEPARVALEVGTHSPWVSDLLSQCGHEVTVANPRMVKLVYGADTKNDKVDAEKLARLARHDPALLSPIRHRGRKARSDLAVIRARYMLVNTRTAFVNHIRGVFKSFGLRAPSCSTGAFPSKVIEILPDELRPALHPLLQELQRITAQIRRYDREIARLCKVRYPETSSIVQVRGVGPLTALAFVLTLEDPFRFRKSRSVGAFLGLRPRQRQSGEVDPNLRITKAGDGDLRRLLVGSAQYILGPFGEDCDLRRFGQKMIDRGGRLARKRAVVAVARKLAVLLHRLWASGSEYEPLRQANRAIKKRPTAAA